MAVCPACHTEDPELDDLDGGIYVCDECSIIGEQIMHEQRMKEEADP